MWLALSILPHIMFVNMSILRFVALMTKLGMVTKHSHVPTWYIISLTPMFINIIFTSSRRFSIESIERIIEGYFFIDAIDHLIICQ